ncbi:MAG: hypothetical protein IT422_02070 [Pirellulaceae bacterium]|nr:hypothetical protein [Pirellulaceae bacterium]
MSDDIRYKYPVWDHLFTLLYPCDESVTNEEVKEDLARLGIDMKPAFQRLHKMIEVQRAKAQFASAKAKRATIGESIHGVVAPRFDDLRQRVNDFVGKMKGDEAQLAYFHKLESAASEEDLQSLLDDLEKLEAIQELPNDSKSK